MNEDFRQRNIPVLFVDLSDMTQQYTIQHNLIGGHGTAILDHLPDECPHCHQGIAPIVLNCNVATPSRYSFVLLCSKHDCKEVFIAYYEKAESWKPLGHQGLVFKGVSIGNQKTKSFHESINKISPNFSEIYNQAFWAEQYKLEQICGVGYRKALEFLIKDYAKKYCPEDKNIDDIEKMLLGVVIKDFITDTQIKTIAERAVWLGNDETHYVRKWDNHDLKDMKKLIDLVLMFMQSKYEYEQLLISMPDRKK